ncbi:MAG: tRNA dihydrouridine synthase DusB [Acidobacteria bacterium]|nr:tRNA dihydrouridine synthase DusB [Acidobacteriota bacterium]
MFKIGTVTIDPPLILAPVAGHTDTLFRQAIKGLGGCGLVVSELVSTEGLTRNQGESRYLTRFEEAERPVSLQIFGSDPKRMADSAALVQDMGADIVDINLGCPVKKVVRQGGGSNLLRDLPLLERIFKAVRSAITIPLTVKIRSGWDLNSVNAPEVLRLAEDCGIEALAIHGRTRCDMFSGKADWNIIARVKAASRIPIMGNGDVFAPEDAERMFRETRVDGVMIGRGVLSNPWLIRQCRDHLAGAAVTPVSLEQKGAFVLDFLARVARDVPAPLALGKMKRMGGYLSKGLTGGAQLRSRIHSAGSCEELLEALRAYFDAYGGACMPAADFTDHADSPAV